MVIEIFLGNKMTDIVNKLLNPPWFIPYTNPLSPDAECLCRKCASRLLVLTFSVPLSKFCDRKMKSAVSELVKQLHLENVDKRQLNRIFSLQESMLSDISLLEKDDFQEFEFVIQKQLKVKIQLSQSVFNYWRELLV